IREGLYKYVNKRERNHSYRTNDELGILINFSTKLDSLLRFSSFHLGPNRTYQSRIYLKQGSTSEINSIIEDFAGNIPNEGSETDQFLKKWLFRFELGHAVKIESIEGFANMVSVEGDGRIVNLTDMGFGAGQLLTILLYVTSIIEKTKTGNAGE